MNLYEIDLAIEEAFTQAVDPETGEVNDEYMAQLDALEMERDRKVENIACFIKNLKADASEGRERRPSEASEGRRSESGEFNEVFILLPCRSKIQQP